MKDNPFNINGFEKKDNNSSWTWKGIPGKGNANGAEDLPVKEFIKDSKKKLREAVLGPGAGAGIGCGIGLGLGVGGGVGIGGGSSSWNQLKMVFGIGMGCGVGLGVGFGQGIGAGRTLESPPKKVIVIEA